MSERMIPLRLADQAVAACEAELQKLRAENARFKAEVANLNEVISDLRISAEDDLDSIETARTENIALKAEVESLTKAGDAMGEEMIKLNHPHASIYLWCKAKEGGQP